MPDLTVVAVEGYRSLRDLRIPLGRLTVVTGPNGSGKSNLYRAVRLLADVAQGSAAGSVAAEGGLPAVLWAGPERPRGARGDAARAQGTVRTRPVALRLGLTWEDLGYAVDLGLPQDGATAFTHDPAFKAEAVWAGPLLRPGSLLVERVGPAVKVRGATGFDYLSAHLGSTDSIVTSGPDAERAPELLELRDRVRSWRFYDQLRTDPGAPARQPQVGTLTPALAGDGRDLAAAVQTVLERGDGQGLAASVDEAFPGSRVHVAVRAGVFELLLDQPGLLRPLRAAELSDGTLRYLLLCAALLPARPPGLLVLNEPETSLHVDLLAPLARLVHRAAERAQVLLVTHSEPLLRHLAALGRDLVRVDLERTAGGTAAPDADRPRWEWPRR